MKRSHFVYIFGWIHPILLWNVANFMCYLGKYTTAIAFYIPVRNVLMIRGEIYFLTPKICFWFFNASQPIMPTCHPGKYLTYVTYVTYLTNVCNICNILNILKVLNVNAGDLGPECQPASHKKLISKAKNHYFSCFWSAEKLHMPLRSV